MSNRLTNRIPEVRKPPDWRTVRLGDIVSFRNGERPTITSNGKYPVFGANGIMGMSASYLVDNPRTILVGRVGASGKVHVTEGKIWPSDNVLYTESCDTEIIDQKFLFYDLTYLDLRKLATQTTHPLISQSALGNIKIICPALSEQRKIASILSTVDDAIEKTDEIIAKTQQLKKGLMQQLLTKGIRHTQFKQTEIGEIPEEWQVVKLNDLIEKRFITYHLDGNHGELYPRPEEFVEQGVPFLSANMLIDGAVDFAKAKYVTEARANQFQKGIAEDGDVLLAHNATVGPVGILETELPRVVIGTTLTAYRCNLESLSNQFLRYYVESNHFQIQLQRIMKQTTRNQVPITAQRNLYFAVPDIDEQREIASILSRTDMKARTEKETKQSLMRLKKGLMQVLLSGRVRVRVD